jgi:signal transduction histidine kinase
VGLRDRKMKLKDAKRLLKSNLDEISKLKDLANDLLSLARYQRGNSFVKEKINMKEVIESVMKNIAPIANKKKVRIVVKSKKIEITANKESLEKLITILLDNAVKYSSKGGKVNLTTETSRRCFILKVKDKGIGISKEDLPHIFDRFYRVDTSRTGVDTSGFGLGLSIAKKIVDTHNGSISAKSSPVKGSTFTVKLPF